MRLKDFPLFILEYFFIETLRVKLSSSFSNHRIISIPKWVCLASKRSISNAKTRQTHAGLLPTARFERNKKTDENTIFLKAAAKFLSYILSTFLFLINLYSMLFLSATDINI